MNILPPLAQMVPFKRLIPITASANAFAATRGIFIETAGSFTILMEEDDTPRTMTLAVGEHPFCITKCTAGTGLWAGY
ncbi:hypothetical protein CO670_15480 [Rhizobium sp. J15]|uniref:hypothetical protein n=1 Tax=Rhizobium sp. J15 TaxID=2035450 RepID=UPI000BEA4744|nr:hypothetical protein [Rhizobium sp. J15]PDT15895.1 hypothetical protein CO670_15480 [Rhizobium sp. J15]